MLYICIYMYMHECVNITRSNNVHDGIQKNLKSKTIRVRIILLNAKLLVNIFIVDLSLLTLYWLVINTYV